MKPQLGDRVRFEYQEDRYLEGVVVSKASHLPNCVIVDCGEPEEGERDRFRFFPVHINNCEVVYRGLF